MVTDDRCHETDFLEAWSSFDASDQVPVNFELVCFLCLAPSSCCSPLHSWTTYGQDFFLARLVILSPPASTWSRLRHCDLPGQEPLRTRATLVGRPRLSPHPQAKVHDANRCMEIAIWLAEHSIICTVRPVALLFIFPEDFGGHHQTGPASPCT